MIDFFQHVALGLSVAITPNNLVLCFLGALAGTLIGVLPGIGPTATVALLLPLTFSMDPIGGLIMLAGIYYGAQYGGSTTSILVNLPGEASSVITCLDGHQLAKQGKAGAALSVAALGSFFAGCVATFVILMVSPVLAQAALKFRPPEYFSLMVFGLIGSVVLAHGSTVKAIGMVLVGLILGLVGADVNSSQLRYTFGLVHLSEGIDFVVLALGLFGIGEIISNLGEGEQHRVVGKIGRLWPERLDLLRSWKPVLRGTGIGSVLGILPGGGALLASFASYTVEKTIAADPSRFGKGAIEGVAGPEAANNAAAQTSFIPLLTLGLPSNSVVAVLLGAMMIHGIVPGPQIIQNQPALFWGLVISMFVGNAMLLVINMPLIGMWVSLLRIPYRLLYPAILSFCAIGAYSVSNSAFEILLLAVFGCAGFLLAKLGCELTPLVLGFILGPLMEENLRRALLLSRGDWMTFVERPVSLAFLLMAAGLMAMITFPALRRLRREAFTE